MNDGTQSNGTNDSNLPADKTKEELVAEELALLKGRAKQMGLTFHPKIGVVALRAKIANRLEGAQDQVDQAEETKASPLTTTKTVAAKATETVTQRNARLRKEAGKLVRVRISCMNPNKSEYEGEIFTVSNAVVGTFKRFVAYNNEEGWHVPQIIFNHLKERECQIFYTVKGPRGNKIRKGRMIKEFAIEIMDPLTPAEIDALKIKQAMANNLD